MKHLSLPGRISVLALVLQGLLPAPDAASPAAQRSSGTRAARRRRTARPARRPAQLSGAEPGDGMVGTLPANAATDPPRPARLGRRWAYRVALGRAPGRHLEGPALYL